MFSNGEKGVLGRSSFEWNKNEFCQLFRHTKNADEFIAVWNQNTTFNKVTQSAQPAFNVAAEAERDDSPEQSCDGVETLCTHSKQTSKRPAEDSLNQGASKKQCISPCPLDECIEAKTAGIAMYAVYYYSIIYLMHTYRLIVLYLLFNRANGDPSLKFA